MDKKNNETNQKPKLKGRSLLRKYKNIGIFLIGLIGFIIVGGIVGQQVYNKTFYNKIPKVYDKDLKVYEDDPSLIIYEDKSKLYNNKTIYKHFFYTSSNDGKSELEDLNGKNNAVAEYTLSKDFEEIRTEPDIIKNLEKELLKNSLAMNYDIYDEAVSIRVSNYSGEYSPYKNLYFKRLDSGVSNSTYLAGFADYANIKYLIGKIEKSSIFDNGYHDIFSNTFLSDEMYDKIENLLVYIDIFPNDNMGKMRINLDLFGDENYERYGKILCLQMEENFKEFSSQEGVYLRSGKCSVKSTKSSMQIIFTFKGIDLHVKNYAELEIDIY